MLNPLVLNVLIVNVSIVSLPLYVQSVLITLFPKMANALLVKMDIIK